MVTILSSMILAADPPAAPELEFVVELKVTLGSSFSVGKTPQGTRFVIPITGGTFEGPDIKGTIISGGADYQMQNSEVTDVEAIYCIKTSDGVYIHVRNRGITAGSYFTLNPRFEAPSYSKYAWLNKAIFICRPGSGMAMNGITLDVWKVK